MDLKQLLAAYERSGERDAELSAAIANPGKRREIYALLQHRPRPPFHGLILAMFEQEVQFRKALTAGTAEDEDDFYEGIYQCALLLYQLGDPNDVFVLWAAKCLDWDISLGLDAEFLLGAGQKQTITWLGQSGRPEASRIIEYLNSRYKEASLSEPEWADRLKQWEQSRSAYFGY